jgi:hypothetical protein
MESATALLSFPTSGELWRDTYEGGLFVMLFVPQSEGFEHECHVDVEIIASSPDAMVSEGRELWPGRYHHRERMGRMEKKSSVAAVLREQGEPGMEVWAWNAVDHDDYSVRMLAAVHLGSTHEALYSTCGHGMWSAVYEDLTQAGKTLYDTLKAVWGTEPVICTFLDT